MANATLHKDYKERIVPALEKEFNYTTVMQVPRLEKIVINQGLGEATQDKKIIETAINELTAITGQKAVATLSRKDISNFKVRKKNPIGARVTLRRDKMYEFLERLVRVALPVSATSRVSRASSTAVATTPSASPSRLSSRNQHRLYLQAAGYEHHLRYIGKDRRRRLRTAQGVRTSLQKR